MTNLAAHVGIGHGILVFIRGGSTANPHIQCLPSISNENCRKEENHWMEVKTKSVSLEIPSAGSSPDLGMLPSETTLNSSLPPSSLSLGKRRGRNKSKCLTNTVPCNLPEERRLKVGVTLLWGKGREGNDVNMEVQVVWKMQLDILHPPPLPQVGPQRGKHRTCDWRRSHVHLGMER